MQKETSANPSIDKNKDSNVTALSISNITNYINQNKDSISENLGGLTGGLAGSTISFITLELFQASQLTKEKLNNVPCINLLNKGQYSKAASSFIWNGIIPPQSGLGGLPLEAKRVICGSLIVMQGGKALSEMLNINDNLGTGVMGGLVTSHLEKTSISKPVNLLLLGTTRFAIFSATKNKTKEIQDEYPEEYKNSNVVKSPYLGCATAAIFSAIPHAAIAICKTSQSTNILTAIALGAKNLCGSPLGLTMKLLSTTVSYGSADYGRENFSSYYRQLIEKHTNQNSEERKKKIDRVVT